MNRMLHRQTQTRCASHRGFTLIEMIATIIILAAIGTAASNILLTAGDSYVDASTTSQLHHELSMTMDRIVREIRQIDLDNDDSEIAPDIKSLKNNSLTWHTNSSISLNGTTLQFVEGGGSPQTLLTDVTAFTLAAYDQDNAALVLPLNNNACDDIRRVSITITINRFGISDTLRSKVFIRSTMAGAGTDPS